MVKTPINYVIVNLLPYLKSTPGKKCSCIRLSKLAKIDTQEMLSMLKHVHREELEEFNLNMYTSGGDYMMWYSKESNKDKVLVERKPTMHKPILL